MVYDFDVRMLFELKDFSAVRLDIYKLPRRTHNGRETRLDILHKARSLRNSDSEPKLETCEQAALGTVLAIVRAVDYLGSHTKGKVIRFGSIWWGYGCQVYWGIAWA